MAIYNFVNHKVLVFSIYHLQLAVFRRNFIKHLANALFYKRQYVTSRIQNLIISKIIRTLWFSLQILISKIIAKKFVIKRVRYIEGRLYFILEILIGSVRSVQETSFFFKKKIGLHFSGIGNLLNCFGPINLPIFLTV